MTVFYLYTLLEHDSEARFSKISFSDDQILKILRALDINKAHGYDELSIRMLKLCDKSIIPPLSLLFQNCIDTRTFLPRYLEEVKYCACSQKRGQTDS